MAPAQTDSLGPAGWARYETALVGPIFVGWVAEGVARLSFSPSPPDDLARWMPELAPDAPTATLPGLLRDGLDRYFAGEPFDPIALPVRVGGTRFQRRVWAALRRVERGQVRTYAGLASDAGSPRAMRAVGAAMGQNPVAILVPCHRVVAQGHALGGFSGGLERKCALLELEGVRVHEGRVLPGQLDLLS